MYVRLPMQTQHTSGNGNPKLMLEEHTSWSYGPSTNLIPNTTGASSDGDDVVLILGEDTIPIRPRGLGPGHYGDPAVTVRYEEIWPDLADTSRCCEMLLIRV